MKNYQFSKLNRTLAEKCKASGKTNSFKRLAVNSEGRLIDATYDVTEQDRARIEYERLKRSQDIADKDSIEAASFWYALPLILAFMVLVSVFVYLLFI